MYMHSQHLYKTKFLSASGRIEKKQNKLRISRNFDYLESVAAGGGGVQSCILLRHLVFEYYDFVGNLMYYFDDRWRALIVR